MKTQLTLPGTKLYEEDVFIEPFTVSDVAELMTIKESNNKLADRDLLNLIDTKLSVSINSIYENDLPFIVWWLRFNTFVDIPYKIRYECPHCEVKQELIITPETIIKNIVPVSEKYKKEGVELQLSENRKVVTKLLTLGEIKEVDSFLNDVLESDSDAVRESLIAIQQLEPELDIYTKYKKYLKEESPDKLTPSEFYRLLAFANDYRYGVRDFVDFNCDNPECKKPVRLRLEVGLIDFFPSNIYN